VEKPCRIDPTWRHSPGMEARCIEDPGHVISTEGLTFIAEPTTRLWGSSGVEGGTLFGTPFADWWEIRRLVISATACYDVLEGVRRLIFEKFQPECWHRVARYSGRLATTPLSCWDYPGPRWTIEDSTCVFDRWSGVAIGMSGPGCYAAP
jgi:hypothetical protein